MRPPKKKEVKKLGKKKIKRLFLRAKALLRVIFTINHIIDDIVLYGTSTNLYDLTTRPKSYVKKMLYPQQLEK